MRAPIPLVEEFQYSLVKVGVLKARRQGGTTFCRSPSARRLTPNLEKLHQMRATIGLFTHHSLIQDL